MRGTVRDSNTGHPCTSGHLIRVELVGSFPGIAVSPPAVSPGQPPPDTTVSADLLDVDPVLGQTCLEGVLTGHVELLPHATMLDVN